MTLERSAASVAALERSRRVQAGGIASLRLPPLEYLPAKTRKAAKTVERLREAHGEARGRIARLDREATVAKVAYRKAIGAALASDNDRPTDPMPELLAQREIAEDDAAGARIAHDAAVAELWKTVPKRSDKSMLSLLEDIAAQEIAAQDALVSIADMLMEVAAMRATLSFLDHREQHRQYVLPVPPQSAVLRQMSAEIADR